MVRYLSLNDVRHCIRACSRDFYGPAGAGVAFTSNRGNELHPGRRPNGEIVTLVRGQNWFRFGGRWSIAAKTFDVWEAEQPA